MLPWIRYVVHVPFEFRSFVEGVPVTPKNSRFLLLSSELSLRVFRESCNPLAGWVDLYRKARRERKSFPLHPDLLKDSISGRSLRYGGTTTLYEHPVPCDGTCTLLFLLVSSFFFPLGKFTASRKVGIFCFLPASSSCFERTSPSSKSKSTQKQNQNVRLRPASQCDQQARSGLARALIN